MTDPISNSTLGGDIGLGVGVVDLSGGIGERGLRKLIDGDINISLKICWRLDYVTLKGE